MTKSARLAQKRGGGSILRNIWEVVKGFVVLAVFLSINTLLVLGFTSGTGLTGARDDALKIWGIVVLVIIDVIIYSYVL